MTDGPKRRGRPPGSRNKPHVLDAFETTGIGIKVLLRFKSEADAEATWPTGWRIPQTGDAVHLRNDYGGFVQYTDFDLENDRIVIYLR